MAQSIRISDDLYEMARHEAGLMHRSVAQQIEHWASLGQALERRADVPEIREVSIAHMRFRDHDRVRRGVLSPDQLALIPRDQIKKAKLVFPKDAFAEYAPKR